MSKSLTFQGRKVQISEGQSISVGRSSLRSKLICQSDNLIFDNAVLSRRHAVLYMADGDIYVKDAASTHGTVYRAPDGTRHPLTPGVPQLLSDKSRLEFGADVLRDSFIHKRLIGTVSLCESPPSPKAQKTSLVSSSETDEEDNFISVYRHKEDETMTEVNYDSPNSSSDQDVLDACYDNVCVGKAELLDSQTPISDIYECETMLNFATNDEEALLEPHVAKTGLQHSDHESQSLAEKKRDILELMSARRAEKTNAMDEEITNGVPLERSEDLPIVTETPLCHDTAVASHYSELDPVIHIDDETTKSSILSQNNLGHLLVDLDTGSTTALEVSTDPVSSYAEGQDDSMSDEAPSEYAIFDPAIGRNVWLEAEEDGSPGALESVNDALGRAIYFEESPDHDWDLDEETTQPLLDVCADQVRSVETSNHLDSDHTEDNLEPLDRAELVVEPHSRLVDDQQPNCNLQPSDDLEDSIHLYVRDKCVPQAKIVGAETMTRKRRASQIDDDSFVHKDKQVRLEASKITWGASMKRTALGVVIGVGLTFGGLAALGASG